MNEQPDSPNLVITLRGGIDDRFFRVARRQFERLLRQPRVSVTLRIEEIREHQRELVSKLLERLGRYGEQVHVHLGEAIGKQITVDTSRIRVIEDSSAT